MLFRSFNTTFFLVVSLRFTANVSSSVLCKCTEIIRISVLSITGNHNSTRIYLPNNSV